MIILKRNSQSNQREINMDYSDILEAQYKKKTIFGKGAILQIGQQ